jgi:hypothetical protein
MSRIQIIGTVRKTDGNHGVLDGLVTSDLRVLSIPEAINLLGKGDELWCQKPSGGDPIKIIAIDDDHDSIPDHVRTERDDIKANNLLWLNIWDRRRRIWVAWTGEAVDCNLIPS